MASSADINAEDVTRYLRGIQIPSRPQLLEEIDRELKRDNPDMALLGRLIQKDVTLSAAVLKTINSPFYGLQKKVGSVAVAVQMLGLRNLRCLVTGLVLKQAVAGEAASLERFWDSSEKVASISAYLSTVLPRIPRDEAYTFGLFREIGIPLMMQRFPDYRDTLKRAAGLDIPMTVVEDEVHATNHAVIGYMVSRAWGLPEAMSEALLLHHDPAVVTSGEGISSTARTLVMLNYLAEHLNDAVLRARVDTQWERVGDAVIGYFGLSAFEMEEITHEVEQF